MAPSHTATVIYLPRSRIPVYSTPLLPKGVAPQGILKRERYRIKKTGFMQESEQIVRRKIDASECFF